MKQVIRNMQGLWRFYAKLSHELPNTDGEFDRPQLVTVTDYKPQRTIAQNARFHVMCRELAEHCGYGESELKDWLKLEYAPKHLVRVGDIERSVPKSSTEWNKAEMAQMIGHLERIAGELNFWFSDPRDATQ